MSRPWRSHLGMIDRRVWVVAGWGPSAGCTHPCFQPQAASAMPTGRSQGVVPTSRGLWGCAPWAGRDRRACWDRAVGTSEETRSRDRPGRRASWSGASATPSRRHRRPYPHGPHPAPPQEGTGKPRPGPGQRDPRRGTAVSRRLHRRRLDLRPAHGVRPHRGRALSPRRHRQPHAPSPGAGGRGLCHRDPARRSGPRALRLPPLHELRSVVLFGTTAPVVDDDERAGVERRCSSTSCPAGARTRAPIG